MISDDTDEHVIIFICDFPKCGVVLECTPDAEGRELWKSEGWRAKAGKHICGDCAIRYMSKPDVQRELRYPKPNSTAFRRQTLWKRLDQLCAC
jgi:hypothetical protein